MVDRNGRVEQRVGGRFWRILELGRVRRYLSPAAGAATNCLSLARSRPRLPDAYVGRAVEDFGAGDSRCFIHREDILVRRLGRDRVGPGCILLHSPRQISGPAPVSTRHAITWNSSSSPAARQLHALHGVVIIHPGLPDVIAERRGESTERLLQRRPNPLFRCHASTVHTCDILVLRLNWRQTRPAVTAGVWHESAAVVTIP